MDDTTQQDQSKNQPDGNDAYLNVDASAAFLGVHSGTIRKAISQGRLTSTLIYGRVVISRTELERYKEKYYPKGIVKRGRGPGSASSVLPKQNEE